jgi:type IV pilus assembly protein PilY1
MAAYRDFRTANQSRARMIYVGANDGMLHGFDAVTGQEKLAYVPTGAYANLSKLTDPFYVHRYLVDGTLASADVLTGSGLTEKWSTVLTSGLGNGGTGFVALDVTDPTQFLERNSSTVVKFEYTAANDPHVGFIPGVVNVVKLNNGKFGAVFANGYNSTGSAKSALIIVDIETGAEIAKLATPAGEEATKDKPATPNALATPLLIDLNGDRTVDVVYAGDQLGNMWKFNLSDKSPAKWGIDYLLFKSDHPITSAPEVGEHPRNGFMVYFGGGKYIEGADVGDATKRAIYGVWDQYLDPNNAEDKAKMTELAKLLGPRVALSELTTQTFEAVGTQFRKATNNSTSGKLGWTATFPNAGERVVSQPLLRDRRLVFTSIIPSKADCSPGGTSWFNELDWLTGGPLPATQLDTNGDGKINGDDSNISGIAIDGIVSNPAIQDSPVKVDGVPQELNLLNTSKGEITSPLGKGDPKRARRLSWRQVK